MLVSVAAVRAADAAPCEGLHGDAALVSAMGDLLARRNVTCGDLRAEIRHEGGGFVVTREDPTAERRVADLATAATVIESWSDPDVTDPLLAAHPIAPIAVAEAGSPPSAEPPRVVIVERQLPPSTFHGSQLFAAAETSFATDRTVWAGGQLGACVVIGPICAEASARFANVVDGPGYWTGLDRRSIEILIGGDVPIEVGRGLVLLGFGGGIAEVHTRIDSLGDHRAASETAGLRAEVRAAYAYPLTRAIAVDATFSLDLTQSTRSEQTTTMPLPAEPLWLARFGVGLRWGHL